MATVVPSTPWIERRFGDFGSTINFLAGLAIFIVIFILIIFKARHINWADNWKRVLSRKKNENYAKNLEINTIYSKESHRSDPSGRVVEKN